MKEISSSSSLKILFVTWDGPQVTYLEGLFLPIFQKLADFGCRFHVLQFTWGDRDQISASRLACEKAGVPYRAVTIWRRPRALGALVTALLRFRTIRRAMRDFDIDIIMPRSTLPALSALLALRHQPVRMVFDADGLPLDERVDFAGLSATGVVYRLLRDVEAQAVRKADAVLTRSHAASKILLDRAGSGTTVEKFHVVSNGRDSKTFSPGREEMRADVRKQLGISLEAPLVVYAGSVGPQYCMDEMSNFFQVLLTRKVDAHFLLLTASPDSASAAIDAFPAIKAAVTVLSVPVNDVHAYLAAADVGLALRRPSFSMRAVAPIKLGEYLLCGLPIIATRGIGDTSTLATEDIGFLVDDGCESQLEEAAAWFANVVLPARNTFRDRCRSVGVEKFSLANAVESYRRALES